MLRPTSLLPSLATAFDAPLWPATSLPSAGACYRALRRLPGQDFHLLEERVFQDAPCLHSIHVGAYARTSQPRCIYGTHQSSSLRLLSAQSLDQATPNIPAFGSGFPGGP